MNPSSQDHSFIPNHHVTPYSVRPPSDFCLTRMMLTILSFLFEARSFGHSHMPCLLAFIYTNPYANQRMLTYHEL